MGTYLDTCKHTHSTHSYTHTYTHTSNMENIEESYPSLDCDSICPGGVHPDQVSAWTDCLESIHRLNTQLTAREEECIRLSQRARRHSVRDEDSAGHTLVPELESLMSIPSPDREKELCMSREEVETLIVKITSTMNESRKMERTGLYPRTTGPG